MASLEILDLGIVCVQLCIANIYLCMFVLPIVKAGLMESVPRNTRRGSGSYMNYCSDVVLLIVI